MDDVGLRAERHRRIALWIAVPLLVLIGTGLLMSIPVGSRGFRTDAITGTIRNTHTYFGFISDSYNVSPPETRLKSMNYKWTPQWEGGCTRPTNIFGLQTGGVYCSFGADILSLRPMLGDFASNASDTEILALVKVLETGTDEEQRAAVRALNNAVMRGKYASKTNTVASR